MCENLRENNRPPLVIIAGPTASGKSAAAVELSKRCSGSVISADSMQVYRGMDIGSAKITRDEMQGIPHYLIDILDPTDEWNVVRFQKEAKAALSDIYAKGRLPFLCGGTGFYIQSLLYDINFTEIREDTSYREELQRIAEREGPKVLHERLRLVDPASADAIPEGNVKRVIRALEYAKESGEKISSHNETEKARSAAYDALYFVLTMERARLYARINERVDRMVREGLVEEVARLKAAGLSASSVSMQGLGYKQILQYLDGTWTLEEAIEEIKIQTRHFAKRQLTWFRREEKRNSSLVWIDKDAFRDTGEMLARMEEKIREHYHI